MVVTVWLSNGCRAVEMMVVVLLKAVVMWKFTLPSGCLVVVSQVPKPQDCLWSGSGGTSSGAGTYTVEWCNSMSNRIFLESLKLWVHDSPLAGTTLFSMGVTALVSQLGHCEDEETLSCRVWVCTGWLMQRPTINNSPGINSLVIPILALFLL